MALSHNQIQALLRAALGEAPDKGFIAVRDVWTERFVYAVYEGDLETLFERTYAIDVDGKVELGVAREVRPVTNYEPVVFDAIEEDVAIFSVDDAPMARLFKLGHYPDKDFSLTEEEADAAIAEGRSFPILLEHGKTAIGPTEFGAVGGMKRVGEWLYGPATVVDSVRTALKGVAPKLSMSWDRVTKRPIECSIVGMPRLTEAGLIAAFSADSGENAEPDKKTDRARTGRAMNVIDFFKKLVGGQTTASEEAQFSALLDNVERMPALESENTSLKTQVAELTEKIGAPAPANFSAALAKPHAESIVSRLEGERKILPAERDEAIARFSRAIGAGPANFSTTGDLVETEVVKDLRESYEGREPYRYGERISASFSAVPGDSSTKAPEKIDHSKAVSDYNVKPQGSR